MSGEKQPSQESKDSIEAKHVSKEHLETLKSNVEKNAEKSKGNPEKEATEARKTVESEAISGKEMPSNGSEKTSQHSITKAEKTRTYKMTMSRTQSQMSAPAKVFSKFIHTPFVEKTSEVTGATIARPSGILGAGVVGFIGMTLILYFARKNGFEISNPYALVAMLFIGGWLTGVLLEFIYKSFKKMLT